MKSKVCKYYDEGRCSHRIAYQKLLDALELRGKDITGIQPRCPGDAQHNKNGTPTCIFLGKE